MNCRSPLCLKMRSGTLLSLSLCLCVSAVQLYSHVSPHELRSQPSMKMPLPSSLVVGRSSLVGHFQISFAQEKPPPPIVLQADLRGDGQTERLVLDPGKDPAVSLWRGTQRLWQDVRRRWRPWKLAVADLEGRGQKEIVVALHKSTRY